MTDNLKTRIAEAIKQHAVIKHANGITLTALGDKVEELTKRDEYHPRGHTPLSYFWFMIDAMAENGITFTRRPTPPEKE